jgi:hypothetical protein
MGVFNKEKHDLGETSILSLSIDRLGFDFNNNSVISLF